MGRLSGKKTFITGAAQGIGRAIAEAFAREGAFVIAADLHWQERPASGTFETLELDLGDEAAVKAAIEAFPGIDVLVNCVGHVMNGTILDCQNDVLERSFSLNVLTMANAIRAALPGMIERGGGSIINIASVVSSTRSAPDRFAYATTKAAVIGLTKSIARDFVGQGVRCNAISPGTILRVRTH